MTRHSIGFLLIALGFITNTNPAFALKIFALHQFHWSESTYHFKVTDEDGANSVSALIHPLNEELKKVNIEIIATEQISFGMLLKLGPCENPGTHRQPEEIKDLVKIAFLEAAGKIDGWKDVRVQKEWDEMGMLERACNSHPVLYNLFGQRIL